MSNQQQKFLLPDLNIRGVIVGLSDCWQEVLNRRTYPKKISSFLGELSAATLLMAADLKFKGKMTVQFQGKSALKLAVVQASDDQKFRALAKIETTTKSLSELLQAGTLVVSVDEESTGELYQGVVAVNSAKVSESIEDYFAQSEQIKTIISLRADKDFACGVILQALPDSVASEDDWHRLKILIETLDTKEFLEVNNTQVMLERLFAEDDKIIYPNVEIGFSCSCSDEKTLGMINTISTNELELILNEGQDLIITCDFCGQEYTHDIPTIQALVDHKKRPN